MVSWREIRTRKGIAVNRIRILVCCLNDSEPECMTELAAFELPQPNLTSGDIEATLDHLEAVTLEIGHLALRVALQAQWGMVDAQLVAAYLGRFPVGQVRRDGSKPITVASRLGTVHLTRQVLVHRATGRHVMPGDIALPAHAGRITTRALQEWGCLLAQDLPFATAARLLGWQTQEDAILSPATLRTLVRHHGSLIRAAEQAEVAAVINLEGCPPSPVRLVPHRESRRRPGWPPALMTAVEVALTRLHPCPPRGVAWSDWARVLAARRADPARSVATLATLGPELEDGQVLVGMDEVFTRAPEQHTFIEVRTARIATPVGYRYVSGMGAAFLSHLRGLLMHAVAQGHSLLVVADCAHWIRDFFGEHLATVAAKTLLLDWHHLQGRCAHEASRACRGRTAKRRFLRRLRRHLWRGDVSAAVRVINQEHPRARSSSTLRTFADYLQARRPYIPSYRDRWRACRYIGSGPSEKANDLLVARRQKGRGMHWSAEMSDALTALQTVRLNQEWDRYWQSEPKAVRFAAVV
jgi:hypothetical protein